MRQGAADHADDTGPGREGERPSTAAVTGLGGGRTAPRTWRAIGEATPRRPRGTAPPVLDRAPRMRRPGPPRSPTAPHRPSGYSASGRPQGPTLTQGPRSTPSGQPRGERRAAWSELQPTWAAEAPGRSTCSAGVRSRGARPCPGFDPSSTPRWTSGFMASHRRCCATTPSTSTATATASRYHRRSSWKNTRDVRVSIAGSDASTLRSS